MQNNHTLSILQIIVTLPRASPKQQEKDQYLLNPHVDLSTKRVDCYSNPSTIHEFLQKCHKSTQRGHKTFLSHFPCDWRTNTPLLLHDFALKCRLCTAPNGISRPFQVADGRQDVTPWSLGDRPQRSPSFLWWKSFGDALCVKPEETEGGITCNLLIKQYHN